MCIAIVKPRGVSLPRDRLETCFENNPDGAGFAIPKDGLVHIHKGYTSFEAFHTAYLEHGVDDHPALVHFRITTRGSNGAENHHPFLLSAGALVHNGTIPWLGKVGQGRSDTHLFAELLHGFSFDQLERLRPMVENSTGWSRFAVLTHAGNFLLFNQAGWEEADGALYSNDSYMPDDLMKPRPSRPLVGTTPTTWDLYGFHWDSDLTLYRRSAEDGASYRDEAAEAEVLDAWLAECGFAPLTAGDWEELDEMTITIIEERQDHGFEQVQTA